MIHLAVILGAIGAAAGLASLAVSLRLEAIAREAAARAGDAADRAEIAVGAADAAVSKPATRRERREEAIEGKVRILRRAAAEAAVRKG